MYSQTNSENQERKRVRDKELEKQFRKRKFLEAHSQLSHFDLMLSMIKYGMDGNDQQKQEKLRKRISKFFDYGDKSIDISNEYFCQKREPNCNANSIPNQLIFYGVDFMSIKALRKRLDPLTPNIIRMDDSHYKAIFQNEEQAFRAIELNIKDQTILKIKAEEEEMQVFRAWFQLKPYNQLGHERQLFCRYATDEQDESAFEESQKRQIYKKAKKQIEKQIINEGKQIYNREVESFRGGERRFGNTRRVERIQRERSREKRGSNRYENNRRENSRRGQIFPHKEQMQVQNLNEGSDEEDEGSFDFILSPHQLNELDKEFQGMALNDKISQIEQDDASINDIPSVNLDFQIDQNNSLNFRNRQQEDYDMQQEYENEDPFKRKQNINTDWSYADYMSEQQRLQQQRNRNKKNKIKKKLEVVILDD